MRTLALSSKCQFGNSGDNSIEISVYYMYGTKNVSDIAGKALKICYMA